MKRHEMIPVTVPIDEADDAPLRRFWWLKRLSLLGVVFILFVVGSWFWLDRRAERQLAEELQQWKREGWPIEVDDFTPPPVADDENAALALNMAAHALVFSAEWSRADNNEEFEKRPWSKQAWKVADQTLAENHPALVALRDARRLPVARWEPRWGAAWFASQINPRHVDSSALLQLANMVKLAAQAAHRQGDDEAFLEYLKDFRFLALSIARDTELMSRFVATGIDSKGTSLASLEAHELQLKTPAARALARELIAAWVSENDLNAKKWMAIAREAASYLDFQRNSEPILLRWNGERPTNERLTKAVWAFLRPQRIAYTARSLTYARHQMQSLRLADWPAVSAAISTTPPPDPFKSDVEPVSAAVLTVSPFGFTSERYVKIWYQRDVEATFAAIHLACRLYAIDHGGSDPLTLAQLVPDYLPFVPRDPFHPGGGPLRYHAATTRPFIYSLGTGSDLVPSGKWMPTLAQHEDWKGGIVASFLNPTDAPVTMPAGTQSLPDAAEK